MRTLDPVKHSEKRQEILAAAARCIARDGFRGASTADICREAGISPGHLYHYFTSKEAILTDITAQGMERVAERFSALMKSDNAVSALIAEIGRHKDKSKKDPEKKVHNRLMLEMLTEAGRNPAIAKIVQKNSAMLHSLLLDFIENGQRRGQIDPDLDARLAAAMLIGVIDGMRTLSIRFPEVDIKSNLNMLQTLIARFLSPPPKPVKR